MESRLEQREAHPENQLDAKSIQKEFTAYFTEQGELDWQYSFL